MNTPFMRLYARYLRQMHISVPPLAYVAFSVVVSALISFMLFLFLHPIVPLILPGGLSEVVFSITYVVPVLVFIVLLDVLVGYPYLKGLSRVEDVERNLADALRQMADTLRAGGTYEFALREVSLGEFGALKEEIALVLRKLEEGENFETAMHSLPENVESRLVSRTVNIIVDSIKAGAGLADVLEDISEDVRESYRVASERKTRTLMQTLFMFATGAVVAPYIFGVVAALITLFSSSAAGLNVSAAEILASNLAGERITIMLSAYIFIEIIASSLMIALMREGKISKAVIYFPVLLFIAFFIFVASRIVSTLMLMGGV